MLTHKHLVGGQWLGSHTTFANQPVTGSADQFSIGTVELVDRACQAAEEAFCSYGFLPSIRRSAFLRRIANEIRKRGPEIVTQGVKETGLPEARLVSEIGRTAGQLELFADHIEAGSYLDKRHDQALPERQPLARPDLKLTQRPVGPVAVFGASNFPLAFSTAGGDTASALAAGCTVVVKGHSAHPGVSDLVAQAINAARVACDLHPGVFNQIQGGRRDVGQALVQHRLIRAIGFTGSFTGGKALFDLCAARPEPIPFFGELGSVNPMFVLNDALASRGKSIADGWAASLALGAGQFCTNPGIAVIPVGDKAFVDHASAALSKIAGQMMLTPGIAEAYRKGQARMASAHGVEAALVSDCAGRDATPSLFVTTADEWLANDVLSEEVFGPLAIVVLAEDADSMREVARSLKGQLTCTLHMSETDEAVAQSLLPILERKAGRIVVNGFPTGVEVCEAMVHGGPFPASTNFGATSVGTLSIRRWLRPVCYQNVLDHLLPAD